MLFKLTVKIFPGVFFSWDFLDALKNHITQIQVRTENLTPLVLEA